MSGPQLVHAVTEHGLYLAGVATKIKKLVRGQTEDERLMANARADFYVRVWTEAANELSMPVQALDGSLLEIAIGDGRLLVRRNITSLDDALTIEISEAKSLVHRLLEARDIPTPRHLRCRYDELSRAWDFVSRTGGAFVVKPAKHGIGGYGVTTGVSTRTSLARALQHARSVEAQVIVEELVAGDVYRLLYLDGELLDAVIRTPAFVMGDGTSTIKQLIDKDNADRLKGGIEAAQELLRVDGDVRQSLAEEGCHLHTVPASGKRIRLKRVANDNRRRDNLPALDKLSESVVAAGRQAAAAVGLRLAGVDVMTSHPELPLASSGGAVLEVNHGPGLYYHYMNTGPGTPVAKMILERLKTAAD